MEIYPQIILREKKIVRASEEFIEIKCIKDKDRLQYNDQR